MQYGSPGSPTINFEIRRISTLNIAILPWAPFTSTSTSPLGSSLHNKNLFEAGYHSNEIPAVTLG